MTSNTARTHEFKSASFESLLHSPKDTNTDLHTHTLYVLWAFTTRGCHRYQQNKKRFLTIFPFMYLYVWIAVFSVVLWSGSGFGHSIAVWVFVYVCGKGREKEIDFSIWYFCAFRWSFTIKDLSLLWDTFPTHILFIICAYRLQYSQCSDLWIISAGKVCSTNNILSSTSCPYQKVAYFKFILLSILMSSSSIF